MAFLTYKLIQDCEVTEQDKNILLRHIIPKQIKNIQDKLAQSIHNVKDTMKKGCRIKELSIDEVRVKERSIPKVPQPVKQSEKVKPLKEKIEKMQWMSH